MMIFQQRIWNYFQKQKSSRFVVRLSLIGMLGLLVLGVTMSIGTTGAHAQSLCAGGASTHIVVEGDTLNRIGSEYGVSWQTLASYNRIANPNLIYIDQVVCIPGKGSASVGSSYQPGTYNKGYSAPPIVNTSSAATGTYNPFPYGTCTWWADQRYFQLHGTYVPWYNNAMAWQWASDAYQYGWHVSGTPTVGAIMDLQPWVEGAYGGGHVAVVEQVLSNGSVIASSMSWGAYPMQVTDWTFTPGPGVTFITP
jgi:surface antigen